MGVRGLAGYVAGHRELASKVDLVAPNATTDSNRILVIDGSGLQFFLYERSQLEWFSGGMYSLFARVCAEFLQRLLDADYRIVVFFDGMQEDIKRQTSAARFRGLVQRVTDTMAALRANTAPSKDLFLKPTLCKRTLMHMLRVKNIETITSVGEADTEMATYCALHNAFAVMAQDSDFIVNGATRYIPFNSVHITPESILCQLYSATTTASVLGLPVSSLPLFACLVGNDYVAFGPTASFHKRVLGVAKSTKSMDLFPAVAAFLRGRADASLEDIARDAFGHIPAEEFATVLAQLQAALHHYDLQQPVRQLPSSIPREMAKAFLTGTLRPEVLTVLLQGEIWWYPCLTQADQLGPLQLLQPMRQLMYGVLLQDSDAVVSEHGQRGPVYQVVGVKANTCYASSAVLPSVYELWGGAALDDRLHVFQVISQSSGLEITDLCAPLAFAATAIYVLVHRDNAVLRELDVDLLIALALASCAEHIGSLSIGTCLNDGCLFAPMAEPTVSSSGMQSWLDIALAQRVTHIISPYAAHVSSLYLQTLDHLLLANEICACPIPSPHPAALYDGALWERISAQGKPLLELVASEHAELAAVLKGRVTRNVIGFRPSAKKKRKQKHKSTVSATRAKPARNANLFSALNET